MHGDLLDLVLLAACALFGFSGYRQGFLVGLLSFVGILGGGYVGTLIAPTAVRHIGDHLSAPVIGILVVFIAASIGQLLAATVGGIIRRHLMFQPLRAVDSIAGAALSVVSVLLVAWLLATAVSHTSLTGLDRQVRKSAIIAVVNDTVPGAVRDDLARFRRAVDNTGFPAIVGPLADEPAAPVAPPDPAVLNGPAVSADKASIVKVRGDAPSCSQVIEGSGFVISADHVLTNAHVVAGVHDPKVYSLNQGALSATVVFFDPNVDIAVLYVPGLNAAPLSFAGTAATGANAVVAGYPEDGGFSAVPARIRDEQPITGPNIYQTKTVTRQVYAVRAVVVPGNSGGPLIATSGTIYGVVFAASTDTADTGYALTASEVAPDVAAGRALTSGVSTGGCD